MQVLQNLLSSLASGVMRVCPCPGRHQYNMQIFLILLPFYPERLRLYPGYILRAIFLNSGCTTLLKIFIHLDEVLTLLLQLVFEILPEHAKPIVVGRLAEVHALSHCPQIQVLHTHGSVGVGYHACFPCARSPFSGWQYTPEVPLSCGAAGCNSLTRISGDSSRCSWRSFIWDLPRYLGGIVDIVAVNRLEHLTVCLSNTLIFFPMDGTAGLTDNTSAPRGAGTAWPLGKRKSKSHISSLRKTPLSSIHLLRPADYAWSQNKGKRQEEPPHIG